ncbi:MAG: hypothetical protein QXP81_01550 [Nitrososphaerota archaeon]
MAAPEHVLELNRTVLIFSAGFLEHGIGEGDLTRLMSAERMKAFGVLPAVIASRVREERLRGLMALAGGKDRTFLFIRGWNGKEGELADYLVKRGVAAYALMPTTLKATLPVHVQLYLDPEVPEQAGPAAQKLGEATRDLLRASLSLKSARWTGDRIRASRLKERVNELTELIPILEADLRRVLADLGVRKNFVRVEGGRVRAEVCGQSFEFRIAGDGQRAVEAMASVLLGPGAGDVKRKASLAEAVDRAIAEGSSEFPLQVHVTALVGERGLTLGLMLGGRILGQLTTERIGSEEELRGWMLEVLGWTGGAPDWAAQSMDRSVRTVWKAVLKAEREGGQRFAAIGDPLWARAVLTFVPLEAKRATELGQQVT